MTKHVKHEDSHAPKHAEHAPAKHAPHIEHAVESGDKAARTRGATHEPSPAQGEPVHIDKRIVEKHETEGLQPKSETQAQPEQPKQPEAPKSEAKPAPVAHFNFAALRPSRCEHRMIGLHGEGKSLALKCEACGVEVPRKL